MIGPNDAPRPAHAYETTSNTELLGSSAITNAIAAITTIEIFETSKTCFSVASFLIRRLKMSVAKDDDATKSCESAVDIIAARIADNIMPATTGGKSFLTTSINTCSLSPSTADGSRPRYAPPITPMRIAAAIVIATQTIAIVAAGLIVRLSLHAIKRTRICGIPQ